MALRTISSSAGWDVQIGPALPRPGRRTAHDRLKHNEQTVRFERPTSRQAFIQDDSERVLIARRPRRSRVHDLLGGKVERRPDHRARPRQRSPADDVVALRDAEIQHLGLDRVRPRRQEDVLGLQIPVRDARLVRGHHRRTHRNHDVRQLLRADRSGPVEALGEILAAQEFHDQIGLARVAAHVGHVDDVRVTNARRQLSLAQKPRPGTGDRGYSRGQDFDSDPLANLGVRGFVDRAHPTGPQKPHDFVLSEARTRAKRRGVLVGSVAGLAHHRQPYRPTTGTSKLPTMGTRVNGPRRCRAKRRPPSPDPRWARPRR